MCINCSLRAYLHMRIFLHNLLVTAVSPTNKRGRSDASAADWDRLAL